MNNEKTVTVSFTQPDKSIVLLEGESLIGSLLVEKGRTKTIVYGNFDRNGAALLIVRALEAIEILDKQFPGAATVAQMIVDSGFLKGEEAIQEEAKS